MLAAGLGTVFAVPSLGGGTPELEPGMWRLLLTTTTNGNPDPVQDFRQCLREELKDLPAYFAPQLESSDAMDVQCSRVRQPSPDGVLAFRMQCSGESLTVDALTVVTIQNPRVFTVRLRIDSRTAQESALVVGEAEGHWTGACPEK